MCGACLSVALNIVNVGIPSSLKDSRPTKTFENAET